jgi:hypothetical protein
MTRYKLINKDCGEVLIDKLTEHLKIKKEEFNTDYINENTDHIYCSLYYFGDAVYIIKKYQKDNLDDALNSFITDEYLTYTEAILLLNGLNPAAGNDIDSEDEAVPRVNSYCSNEILHDYLYRNNKEFRQLSKAVEARDGFAFEEDSNVLIYTEAFISWAIEKGFIEEVSGADDQNPATEKYSTQQKNYNTVTVLIALEKRWEEDKSNNKEKTKVGTLLKDENTKFYNSIKSKLASKNEQSNELPLAKTLRNYISQYNTFKALLNKD